MPRISRTQLVIRHWPLIDSKVSGAINFLTFARICSAGHSKQKSNRCWSQSAHRPDIAKATKVCFEGKSGSGLADVRDLEKHLPAPYRHKATWRHVSTQLAQGAEGEKDLLEICVSLRLVLALEGVECLMK
jgi:hypothetical protein